MDDNTASMTPSFLEHERDILQQFIHLRAFPVYPIKLDGSPKDNFGIPIWNPFALRSSVTSDGTETKLMVSPVLSATLAVPIISTTDLNKHFIPAAFVGITYDCRHSDDENIKQIQCRLSKTLRIWELVIKAFTPETFSSFNENEMLGTLVLRRTIAMSLELYKTIADISWLLKDDSDDSFSFALRH